MTFLLTQLLGASNRTVASTDLSQDTQNNVEWELITLLALGVLAACTYFQHKNSSRVLAEHRIVRQPTSVDQVPEEQKVAADGYRPLFHAEKFPRGRLLFSQKA